MWHPRPFPTHSLPSNIGVNTHIAAISHRQFQLWRAINQKENKKGKEAMCDRIQRVFRRVFEIQQTFH